MGNEEIISKIWSCLNAPLLKNGLHWAEEKQRGELKRLNIKNPIKIKVAPNKCQATVQIDTKCLASEPDTVMHALWDMELALYKKYGELKLYFLYGTRSITFQIAQ